jgi:hypothetical protein
VPRPLRPSKVSLATVWSIRYVANGGRELGVARRQGPAGQRRNPARGQGYGDPAPGAGCRRFSAGLWGFAPRPCDGRHDARSAKYRAARGRLMACSRGQPRVGGHWGPLVMPTGRPRSGPTGAADRTTGSGRAGRC